VVLLHTLDGTKSSRIFLASAFLLLIGCLGILPVRSLQGSKGIPSYGTISQSPSLNIGVNYLSLYHMYSTTDAILRRDFKLFTEKNISIVALNLYWYNIETARGTYNDAFLDDVKRVIGIASEYGLRVLVTLHTLWGDEDSAWCTPDYVIDPYSGNKCGLAIVRSEDLKTAFLGMFIHVVRYVQMPEVYAWAILNEPWYWGRTSEEHDFVTSNGKTQRENFIDIIKEQSLIVKQFSNAYVTIRFVNNLADGGDIFIRDWNFDPEIFDRLDFVSFNAYIPLETDPLFADIDTRTRENTNGCVTRGKKVWITEFGSADDDNELQREVYAHAVEYYKNLDIDSILPWLWMSEVAPTGWSQIPEFGGFNLANPDGSPRPALYELSSTLAKNEL
jgi:hypothetical protein